MLPLLKRVVCEQYRADAFVFLRMRLRNLAHLGHVSAGGTTGSRSPTTSRRPLTRLSSVRLPAVTMVCIVNYLPRARVCQGTLTGTSGTRSADTSRTASTNTSVKMTTDAPLATTATTRLPAAPAMCRLFAVSLTGAMAS